MSEISRQSSRRSSRRSSRQRGLPSDDTTSLTSFPDPAESLSLSPTHSPPPREALRLNGLLDVTGPSMFDEQDTDPSQPQVLSTAAPEIIQNILDHHGAITLVRRLSALLAERDAHVTALVRLAEEYKIPSERIAETCDRVRQAEQRRLSLAAALLEEISHAPVHVSDSDGSDALPTVSDPNATIRGFTKLFGGGTSKRRSVMSPATDSDQTSQSTSRRASTNTRPQSTDVQSVTSVESVGWTASLWRAGGTIKNLSQVKKQQQDSRPPREPVEMSTRHDRDQLPPTLSHTTKDPQEAEWNKFIVKLMKAREQAGIDARSGELIGASHFGTEGATGRYKMEQLTRLVVGGIPMNLRHQIWMELSNATAIIQPDAYPHYLSQPPPDDDAPTFTLEIDAILKDVPRTLTSKYDFYADKGYDRLKRVLVAFVAKYPGLGYTQGLNMIAGYLLLAIPEEADAFWLLCAMVDSGGFFPPGYFARATGLAGPIADVAVLRAHVVDLLPRLAERLAALDVDPRNTVPLSWFLTAYAGVLPAPALLRVWDVWLCLPGQKTFLFNVALALLAMHQKALCECETQEEYFAYMDGKCKVEEDEPERINELVRQAFVMRKRLEHVEVRRAAALKKVMREASLDALEGETRED